jgi:dipeptidyl aminopeptidase/acylaminoacyl peptidase
MSNPDGSVPTQVLTSKYEIHGDLHHSLAPAGDRLAAVISTDQGLDLVVVNIPSLDTEIVIHLLSITNTESATSPTSFAAYAIRDYKHVAWQPGDGRLLAFTGAINGPTSDVYLYDTQTKKITQLTDEPSQAIEPDWSPDGQYLLYSGVSWVPPFGGAIIGHNKLNGIWAVHASDTKAIALPTNANMIGWQDATHYLAYDSDEKCTSQNLRSVDLVSGAAQPILDASFDHYFGRSPDGAILFSSVAGCPKSLGDGVFLLAPGQTTPRKLLDKRVYEIKWLPESKLFQAYPEALFSADGATRYDPPVYEASYNPAVSKDGSQAWEVIQQQRGRVMVQVPGGTWQKIMDGLVGQLIWDSTTGKTLLIAMQDGSLYAATSPDFTPRLIGNIGGYSTQAIWVP